MRALQKGHAGTASLDFSTSILCGCLKLRGGLTKVGRWPKLSLKAVRSWRQIQPVDATHSVNISACVWTSNVSRGLSFNRLAIALSRSRDKHKMSMPLCMYCWSRRSSANTCGARRALSARTTLRCPSRTLPRMQVWPRTARRQRSRKVCLNQFRSLLRNVSRSARLRPEVASEFSASCRIDRGPAKPQRIEFCTEQKRQPGHVQPQHENDHRADASVGRAVVAEVLNISRESDR